MQVRPGKNKPSDETRGSGPGAKNRRSDAQGPRKAMIIRMPEDLADQLKAVAALERTTVQDFCLDAILPLLKTAATCFVRTGCMDPWPAR